ncbi:MAG: acetyl-CoA carboxylase biotin carboxyl carrier protein [Candidatus Tritonobacter lacicola]|nr:acetyl-CoA carboxylase biotin carboxyl carrier protein [Candidatus Tritonobacter lacicola]
MNLKEIREIINLMNDYDLTEFSMERDGFKMALKRGPEGAIMSQSPIIERVAELVEKAAVEKKEEEQPRGAEIVSPMVGTFYASPSPDSSPYVEVGQIVDTEDVVCIIEAMKVMNEIKADIKGKIIDVLVEGGEPVEFGQPLFLIEPVE